MAHDKIQNTSGQAVYEQNMPCSHETQSASIPNTQEHFYINDKGDTAKIYRCNKPFREVIYADIVKQESQGKKCTETQQTKPTE